MANVWGGQSFTLYGEDATLRLDGFLLRPLLSLFSSLILCGLLMLFGFSASGTIEVGVLYAFISYLGRLNEPLIETDHATGDAATGCCCW